MGTLIMRSRVIALLMLSLLATGTLAATPWRTDAGSELRFRATQAGAEFEGRFARFSASIVFDERDLAGSRFDVEVTTASVETQDADRDTALKDADFFHVGKYPQARFVATKFRRVASGFVADGQLTLRGVTRPVPVSFTFTRAGTGATLTGTALLRRLDFGVGQGEWRSTDAVGNEVKVLFTLRLSPAAAKTGSLAARPPVATRG
jgi:polyisoprenoid-binding protein YceI